MRVAEVLCEQLEYTRDWTNRLLADLEGDDWSFQPGAGLAHAHYLVGHLAVSQHVLVFVRVLNRPLLPESFTAHFPIGAAIRSTREYSYPPLADVLCVFEETQAATMKTVRDMGDELLREPAFAADGKSPHPHYRDKLGAVSHCWRHEAFHAGQIATIRRLRGRNFLR
ncbi:MAG: DinB family protein [Phycisphaerales bacterium]|nr:DinB family protein [Phycisphaerales bacterium]